MHRAAQTASPSNVVPKATNPVTNLNRENSPQLHSAAQTPPRAEPSSPAGSEACLKDTQLVKGCKAYKENQQKASAWSGRRIKIFVRRARKCFALIQCAWLRRSADHARPGLREGK